MKRKLLTALATMLGACGSADQSATAEASAEPAVDRAVSLRVLQELVRQCGRLDKCSNAVIYLGGMTRIHGYAIDRQHRDIVLLGSGDISKGGRPLYLADLIALLRNSWLKYAPLKDGVHQYAYPGCSIDMEAHVVEQLELPPPADRGQSQETELIEQWFRLASTPQMVRTMGIPASPALATMVDADYLLKSIVNGSAETGIDGFQSLLDMRVEQWRESGADIAGGESSIDRFWFYPGDPLFIDSGDGVLIEELPVLLGTEAERVSGHRLEGTGRSDLLAARFSREFTRRFADIKRIYPVFEDLENVFRLFAVTQVLRFRDAPRTAGLDLSYLLDNAELPQDPRWQVPAAVHGVSRVHMAATTRDSGPAAVRMALVGGVELKVEPSDRHLQDDPDGSYAELTLRLLRARPSPFELFWSLNASVASTRSIPGAVAERGAATD